MLDVSPPPTGDRPAGGEYFARGPRVAGAKAEGVPRFMGGRIRGTPSAGLPATFFFSYQAKPIRAFDPITHRIKSWRARGPTDPIVCGGDDEAKTEQAVRGGSAAKAKRNLNSLPKFGRAHVNSSHTV